SRLPQLLINGASGIAVGMATNIPPHNVSEIARALEAVIENPEISIDQLMHFVKGPDFPTRGFIYGVAGIRQAFMTGHGAVTMRAGAAIEDSKKSGKEEIVITEIPYEVNKDRLIENIAYLVHQTRLGGISHIREESAPNEMRIVIECNKGENADI